MNRVKQLEGALREAISEIREHNGEYHHVTSRICLDALDAALSGPEPVVAPSDSDMLNFLQSMIDPERQMANGGFVTQTLEIRDNATLRESIRIAMKESAQ